MNQERFGQVIKELRKKHNLTQKQLADKYNVTYQAVSKWENGLNMPDTSLIKQISKDFNIGLEELLNGEYKEKKKIGKKKKWLWIIIPATIVIVLMLVFVLRTINDDFNFKTLSSTCNNFNISGSIAYNESKSAIYITNIEYCGEEEDETEYKNIECILFESNNNVDIKISSFKSVKENIKLKDFLDDVTLSIDNYEKNCDEYNDNSLYLAINATDKNDKITTYRIPLTLDSCAA